MASYFPMVKNAAQRIVFPILDADGDPVTGAAADTPDSEYSLDGGSFVDITDEIHEIATTSGIYYLDLTAGETNGDVVCIQVKTATAGTKTTVLVFYTSAQSLDTTDAAVDAIPTTAMRGTDNAALASAWTSALATALGSYTAARAGYLDELGSANIPADVDTLKTYCDILDHATNGLANIKSLIDTLSTYVDTEITSIKTVTDKVDDTLEDDAGTYRFTENALEEAPSGTGGDATATNQTRIIQILTGKWAVTGNQFIIYDSDGTTALYTYNLTQDGVATEYNPDLRTPV